MIEGYSYGFSYQRVETRKEYHKRRAKEEEELIKSLIGKYGYKDGSKANIKRARKRKKYHERMARSVN